MTKTKFLIGARPFPITSRPKSRSWDTKDTRSSSKWSLVNKEVKVFVWEQDAFGIPTRIAMPVTFL